MSYNNIVVERVGSMTTCNALHNNYCTYRSEDGSSVLVTNACRTLFLAFLRAAVILWSVAVVVVRLDYTTAETREGAQTHTAHVTGRIIIWISRITIILAIRCVYLSGAKLVRKKRGVRVRQKSPTTELEIRRKRGRGSIGSRAPHVYYLYV